MRAPRVPAISTPATRLAAAVLLAGCAGEGGSRSARVCTASNQAIDAYVARIAGLASNQARGDVLEPREMVQVSFAIATDGAASDFRLVRPSRPAAAEEVLRAAAAAAPYPRPPFDPAACLVGGRATIWLIGDVRCDGTRADEYTEAVALRIQRAVSEARITAPQSEKIALRVKLDRNGAADSIRVHDAQSAEIGDRVAEVARKLAPFEAPGDAIAQCVADRPFFVWIHLSGETRPPIRVR
jgi:CRISPR/Cas system-associated endoribonuclease Cas2